MNNFKKISITTLCIFTLIPVFAFAQAKLQEPTGPGTSEKAPLVTCGGLDSNGKPQPDCVAQDVVDITQKIMNLAFISAGFIVAIMFMYAGFLLITSAGDTGKIQKAKNIFKRTVIGFIIMYLSYILVLNTLTRIGAADFFKNIISGDGGGSRTTSDMSTGNTNTSVQNNTANMDNLANYIANLPADYQSMLDLSCVCHDGVCRNKELLSKNYVDTIFAILKTNIPIAYAQSTIQSGTQKVIDSMKRNDMNKSNEVFTYVITYKDGKTEVVKPTYEKRDGTSYVLNTEKLFETISVNRWDISEIDTIHTHPPKLLENMVKTFNQNYQDRITYLEKNAKTEEEKNELKILKNDPLRIEYKKTDLAPPSSGDLLLDDGQNKALLKIINDALVSIGYEKNIKVNHYVVENNGVWTFSATPEVIKSLKDKQILCTELNRFFGDEKDRAKIVQQHVDEIKKMGIKLEFTPHNLSQNSIRNSVIR